jgi:phage terminase large subunit
VLRQPAQAEQRWALPPADPQPRQQALLSCTADEALYGGAVGGGKSWTAVRAAIEYIHQYPGASALLVRQTFPQLSQAGGLIPLSQSMLRGVAQYNESRHRWTFPCGGTLQFGHCSSRSDYTQYLGSEYEWIGYDEATQLPIDAIGFINSRCRSARGYPTRIRYYTNPGGISGSYFRQEFVEAAEPEQVFRVRKTVAGVPVEVSRCYIPSRLDDNRYLDKSAYLVSLSGLPEQLVQSLVEGRWDVLAGQFYGEFSPRVHLCDPFPIPAHWHTYVGIDYGFNNPCGVAWGRMSPDGVLYVVHTERVRLMEPDQVAAIIHEYNEEHGLRVMRYGAGPDLFTGISKQTRGGPSDEEAFKRAGIAVSNVCPGALGKRHRFGNARRYLRWRGEDGQPEPGKPLCRIFRGVQWLPEQIQEAMIDPDDPECVLDNPADSEGRGGDDVADAWTHLCMCRPIQSREPKPAPVPGSIDFLREQERRRRAGRPLLRTRTDEHGREYVVDWKG